MRRILPFLLLATTPVALAARSAAPLHASRSTVVYGAPVRLSGQFAHRKAGQAVVVLAKEYGKARYASSARVRTGPEGRWSLSVQPTIATSYKATSLTEQTRAVTAWVRPRVTLTKRAGRIFVRVAADRSYAGHYVYVQRLVAGTWRSMARVVLHRPPRSFRLPLPRGVWKVRAFLPRRQAGPGYLASNSRPILVGH